MTANYLLTYKTKAGTVTAYQDEASVSNILVYEEKEECYSFQS